MPHFDEYGGDSWLCQVCLKVQNSRTKSVWRPDIAGHKSAGNVCPDCLKQYEEQRLAIWNAKYFGGEG